MGVSNPTIPPALSTFHESHLAFCEFHISRLGRIRYMSYIVMTKWQLQKLNIYRIKNEYYKKENRNIITIWYKKDKRNKNKVPFSLVCRNVKIVNATQLHNSGIKQKISTSNLYSLLNQLMIFMSSQTHFSYFTHPVTFPSHVYEKLSFSESRLDLNETHSTVSFS